MSPSPGAALYPTTKHAAPTYQSDAEIEAQGGDKMLAKGNLDPTGVGDKWVSLGVAENGLNLTVVVPDMGTRDKSFENYKKTKQHYGMFESSKAAAAFMNSQPQAPGGSK